MGTKQSAISRFESGKANPTLDFLYRLADALGAQMKVTIK
jgi:transcriptional regulator with XRE-family HTH domain